MGVEGQVVLRTLIEDELNVRLKIMAAKKRVSVRELVVSLLNKATNYNNTTEIKDEKPTIKNANAGISKARRNLALVPCKHAKKPSARDIQPRQ